MNHFESYRQRLTNPDAKEAANGAAAIRRLAQQLRDIPERGGRDLADSLESIATTFEFGLVTADMILSFSNRKQAKEQPHE